jgi:hypothetical protein
MLLAQAAEVSAPLFEPDEPDEPELVEESLLVELDAESVFAVSSFLAPLAVSVVASADFFGALE